MNVSPRIVDPVGPRGQEHPLPLFSDVNLAKVFAADDDGDDLLFSWNVPGYPNLQPTTSVDESGLWSSVVQIPYDPDLDGDLIRVVVIDQSPALNSETVLFRVELP